MATSAERTYLQFLQQSLDSITPKQGSVNFSFLFIFSLCLVLFVNGRTLFYPEAAESFYLVVPFQDLAFILHGFAPDDYFRPLWHAVNQIIYELFGFNIFALHVILVVLLAGTGAVFSHIFLRAGFDAKIVIGAIIFWQFSVPVTYSALWFSQFSDSFNALLAGSTLLMFTTYMSSGRLTTLVWALAIWLASVLVKEQTFALPLLFVLIMLIRKERRLTPYMATIGFFGAYIVAKTVYHNTLSGGTAGLNWDTSIQNEGAGSFDTINWAAAKIVHLFEGIIYSIVPIQLADTASQIYVGLACIALVFGLAIKYFWSASTAQRMQFLVIGLLLVVFMPHAPFNPHPRTLLVSTFFGTVLVMQIFKIDSLNFNGLSVKHNSARALVPLILLVAPVAFSASMSNHVAFVFSKGSPDHRINTQGMLDKITIEKYSLSLDAEKQALLRSYVGGSNGMLSGTSFGEITLWRQWKRRLFYGDANHQAGK